MAGDPRPKTPPPDPRPQGWNTTLPAPRKRVNPVSAKRAAEKDARAEVREVTAARAGGVCQARDLVPEVKCWGPLDTDERQSRGARPGAHLEAELTQLLCRGHHRWKHDHPARARELGLTERSTYELEGKAR